jgi:hypothetical protein
VARGLASLEGVVEVEVLAQSEGHPALALCYFGQGAEGMEEGGAEGGVGEAAAKQSKKHSEECYCLYPLETEVVAQSRMPLAIWRWHGNNAEQRERGISGRKW